MVPQDKQRDDQNQNHNSRKCEDSNSQYVWACRKEKKIESKQLDERH